MQYLRIGKRTGNLLIAQITPEVEKEAEEKFGGEFEPVRELVESWSNEDYEYRLALTELPEGLYRRLP